MISVLRAIVSALSKDASVNRAIARSKNVEDLREIVIPAILTAGILAGVAYILRTDKIPAQEV